MRGQLGEMLGRHAQSGRVSWIGRRPERRGDVEICEDVRVTEAGIAGDHAPAGKRAVTLFQGEHLPVIGSFLGTISPEPATLRRNIVVEGINLAALRKAQVILGEVIVLIEGPCPPCSRMEEVLGPGGYNAMRGHGGWYSSVIQPGRVKLGDPVSLHHLP